MHSSDDLEWEKAKEIAHCKKVDTMVETVIQYMQRRKKEKRYNNKE